MFVYSQPWVLVYSQRGIFVYFLNLRFEFAGSVRQGGAVPVMPGAVWPSILERPGPREGRGADLWRSLRTVPAGTAPQNTVTSGVKTSGGLQLVL